MRKSVVFRCNMNYEIPNMNFCPQNISSSQYHTKSGTHSVVLRIPIVIDLEPQSWHMCSYIISSAPNVVLLKIKTITCLSGLRSIFRYKEF